MGTELKVGGKQVFMTPKGFKAGSKGKVIAPGEFIGNLESKGERRKLRKFARSNGFNGHASARTTVGV